MNSAVINRIHQPPARARRLPHQGSQRGMILYFTVIAIVMLLIGSVALVRSFDGSLTIAGGMAFKRDLVNQGERGIAAAKKTLAAGGPLGTETTRQSNQQGNNYSASMLASDGHGIPKILLDEAAWSTAGMSQPDIADPISKVTIRYVIDRLCKDPGPASPTVCTVSTLGSDTGGTAWLNKAGGASLPVYRVSLRVTGPQNAQTFMQSTFAL